MKTNFYLILFILTLFSCNKEADTAPVLNEQTARKDIKGTWEVYDTDVVYYDKEGEPILVSDMEDGFYRYKFDNNTVNVAASYNLGRSTDLPYTIAKTDGKLKLCMTKQSGTESFCIQSINSGEMTWICETFNTFCFIENSRYPVAKAITTVHLNRIIAR